ncbi:MAG: hypothetical protein EPO32_01580 [Anaerolineae bacterium]|nr:MAG: hypothetical protein EPO32_01580 [Anaerolineae bacterium]
MRKVINRKLVIANSLIGLGVAVWIPYLLAIGAGEHPSIFPTLVVHLVLVLGGARMKRRGRSQSEPVNRSRHRLGLALVIAGVLVWIPYLYTKHILHEQLSIAPYLVGHLSGVALGGYLRLSSSPTPKTLNGESNDDTR